jgi:hypothetical protein
MQIRDNLSLRLTVSTLLGLAILGWAATVPAYGQATPNRTKSVSRRSSAEKKAMAERDIDADVNGDDADPAMTDPAPVGYPQAAPGSIDQYHWTDYTRKFLASGSVSEERAVRRELREKRRKAHQEQLNSMLGTYSPSTYTQPSNSASDYTADQTRITTSTTQNTITWSNWSPMAASGDFLYMVRGNTLYKLNNSDLSIITQKVLPAITSTDTTTTTTYSVPSGPMSITAAGDYVYVVRGDMLYQWRTSDLSFVSSYEEER